MLVEVEDNNDAMIDLRTRDDDVTLEYDDSVLLIFTPDEDDLIEFYEGEGEYIRDSMTIHIIDNDRKQTVIGWLVFELIVIFYCRIRDKF